MSEEDPPGGGRRDDKTAIRRPDPGRRRSRRSHEPSAAEEGADRTQVRRVTRDKTVIKPTSRRRVRPKDKGQTKSHVASEELISNPLLDESGEILATLAAVTRRTEYFEVEALRAFFVRELLEFDERVRGAAVSGDTAERAKYILAGFVDEGILNTPWGKGGWTSLAEDFGYDILRAGEEVFAILERAAAPGDRDYDLLELIYVCLSLGFVGKYALSKDWEELRRTRKWVYEIIRERREVSSHPISPHWESGVAETKPLSSHIPLWVIASVAVAALIMMYFSYSWALHGISDEKRDRLEVLPPPSLVQSNECDRCPPGPACPLDCVGCPDDPRCPRCDACPPDPRCPADCDRCMADPRCESPPPDPCAQCPPDPVWCKKDCDACAEDPRCKCDLCPPDPDFCPSDCATCPIDKRCLSRPAACPADVLVTYDHGQARLSPEKEAMLDRVVETLRNEKGITIEILGRTDYTGSKAVNERISRQRAVIVHDYLTKAGIDGARMKFAALWDSDPLRPKDPAEFRRINRSTQVKYLCGK